MPPKRRKGLDLPPNLYPATDTRDGKTRYRYRDPRSGKFHGMGTDKALAIADAKALNAIILQAQSRVSAIAVQTPDTPKLSAVILRHEELSEARHARGKLATSTLKKKKGYCRAIRKALGDKPIGDVSVRDIAELLSRYEGKESAGLECRKEACEIWKTAMHEGWATDNTPEKTRPPEIEVKRSRLTLDNWRMVRESANGLEPWIGLSMDLAIITAQRVEDIGLMEFKPREGATAWIQDGSLYVIQGKTGSRVCIPLSLRLEVLGLELGEIVSRCRDTSLSRYLIHFNRNHSVARRGAPVGRQTISRGFNTARDLSCISWDTGKTAPTFHEQRSLSIRLHTEQGTDAQALAGHKMAATTDGYRDSRGAEWVKVSA